MPSVPLGRGRWRLTVHKRSFATTPGSGPTWQSTMIAELTDARGRRLDRAWNSAAQLTFTLDGSSSQAPLVLELATDVVAWRWSDTQGQDVAMFRGLVDHSEDQLTQDAGVVTFTAHDYFALLQRRYLTTAYSVVQDDQDNIVRDLVARANTTSSSSGTSLAPGAQLPLAPFYVQPDGSQRLGSPSGALRDRTYAPSQEIGAAIDDLAKVIGGFDYDVNPYQVQWSNTADALRVFYPQQGVTRADVALVYGSNVATVTRTVSSGDYANYVRVLGNNGSSDPAAAQRFSEAWDSDANNVTVNPVGLWQSTDNASDVTVQSTLDDKAAGDLELSGILVPSYTLTLVPGTYRYGSPNMGDTVGLVIQAGRLNVNTTVRVMGISYAIGDDGDEDVQLTVGRPVTTLAKLFTPSRAGRGRPRQKVGHHGALFTHVDARRELSGGAGPHGGGRRPRRWRRAAGGQFRGHDAHGGGHVHERANCRRAGRGAGERHRPRGRISACAMPPRW